MVDNIPKFSEVTKTKNVMRTILGGRHYEDDSDYFEDSQPKPLVVKES